MKKKITSLTYSLLLALIWWIGLIDILADQLTASLALIFTFTATYFLRKKVQFDFWDKLLVVSFPTFYCFAWAFQWESFNLGLLIYPLNIALVLLILSLTYFKDLTKPQNIFIFLFCTILYSYRFYPEWSKKRNPYQVENVDSNKGIQNAIPDEIQNVVKDTIQVLDYLFGNMNGKKARLDLDDRYIMLETWSEACPPCVKAFSELGPFYDAHADKLRTYYVYENNRSSARKNLDKIRNYKHIHDKSKILVDLDQTLYLECQMSGYPYFLLFSPEGELVYSQSGYQSDIRIAFEKKVLSEIGGMIKLNYRYV